MTPRQQHRSPAEPTSRRLTAAEVIATVALIAVLLLAMAIAGGFDREDQVTGTTTTRAVGR